MQSIRQVDPAQIDETAFKSRFADCVVLTMDGKILLQQRTSNSGRSAGFLTTFGGHIESGENPLQALVRELREELGAEVMPSDVVNIGAITEAETNHTEVIYTHFWHDRNNTITGCYEYEAVYYDRIAGALAHPKIMDYVVWLLQQCQMRRLLS